MNELFVFNESKMMDLDVVYNLDGKNVIYKEVYNLYGLYMSKVIFEGLKWFVLNECLFLFICVGYVGV